jgi:hypothetical protein
MIKAYSAGSPMLRRYIELNNIKAAFYFKTDNREYTVYCGDAVARTGVESGKFRTMREAIAECEEINRLIQSVE